MDSSPWGDDEHLESETEWTKMSTEFTNAGYREGIIAGKDLSVQQGFNDGYVSGAALGRTAGIARGSSSAILSFLTSIRSQTLPDNVRESRTQDLREIHAIFSGFHFKDILPEHSRADNDDNDDEMLSDRRDKWLAKVSELNAKVQNSARLIGLNDHVIENTCN